MADKGLPATLDIIETMVQTKEQRTSAGLGERCPIHGCGLNFYSSKEQGFKCLSCLINKEDVQYIDKSYIAQMELFNEIRAKTELAISNNAGAVSDISRWREDIRDMVMRIRSNLILFIDEFVAHLKKNMIDIETQPQIKDFINEDLRQEERLNDLKEKHREIQLIIDTVEATPRH